MIRGESVSLEVVAIDHGPDAIITNERLHFDIKRIASVSISLCNHHKVIISICECEDPTPSRTGMLSAFSRIVSFAT